MKLTPEVSGPADPGAAGPGLTLRDAQPDDVALLSVLATHVYVATYCEAGAEARMSGLRPEQAREAVANYSVAEFGRRLARGHRITMAQMAHHGEMLLGFAETALAAAVPGAADLGAALEVVRLYVAPGAQRQGVGRRLLEHAEALAAERGGSALWLSAWAGNANARAFYARMGYADIGATDYCFEDQVFENRVLVKRLARAGLPPRAESIAPTAPSAPSHGR